MKVSHGQLESFRADPAGFASRQAGRRFGGLSMFRVWQYALKRVHSGDVDDAVEWLRDTTHATFRVNTANERKLEGLIEALRQYAAAFTSLGHVAVEVLKPMNLVVSPKLTVSGEIARLDIVPEGGYAAFVLSRETREAWKSQIRFPLIQEHFATKLNVSVRDVAVGIYSIPDGGHEMRRFSAARVKGAQAELISLASRLP